MSTNLENSKKIISDYKDFPKSLRSSHEDIIKRLRGDTIRGKSIYSMEDKQVYSIAQRLYGEARQTVQSGLENNIDPVLDPSVKRKTIDEKVEQQGTLFDNSPNPYQE